MAANREILMKFITGQNERLRQDISKQGYKDNSPYRNNPSNTIYGTPEGTSITMEGVSTPLIGIDEFGNRQEMFPGQKYEYPGSRVVETPMVKYGGLLNKTIKCSNCGWSWKAADGGNDVSTCHKCGNDNIIMQVGGEADFNKVKEWYNNYIDSPLYKRNLQNSGYPDVDKVIEQRKSNIGKTEYVYDENRLGTYYQSNTNVVHHAPKKDSEIWSKEYESVLPQDTVLAHEFGHSVLDNSKTFFGRQTPGYNRYDYEQLQSRNKDRKISRGADENYADQKALQYEAAKLGIYKPGFEEFTKEHLDKLPVDIKDRALQNYSEEDLIWLMNNIAQNDNNTSDVYVAKRGGTWFGNADEMSVSNKYQNAGTVKKKKKWLGNDLTPEGWITSATKGGNRISFTGNQRNDDWINKQIDSGKFGFDPKTQMTFPLKKPVKGLSKEDQFMATKQYHDLRASQGFTSESQQAQIEKLPKWQQDMLNAENEKRRKNVVYNNMQEVVKNPLFYAPGAIALAPIAAAGLTEAGILAAPYIEGALATQLPGLASVPGATVGNAINAGFASHGLMHVGPDAVKMVKDPSLENAGNLAMDALEIAPVAGPALKIIGEGAGTLKKEFNALNDFAKNKELLRLERQAQNYHNNRLNNLDIEEVRRAFHNSERFLTPEEIELLRRHGRGATEDYRLPPAPSFENQTGLVGVPDTQTSFNYSTEEALNRLNSGMDLQPEHLNVLGNEYNSHNLSLADSEAFQRYITGNRGSINLRRGAARTADNPHGGRTYQLDDHYPPADPNYNTPNYVVRNRSGFKKEDLINKADEAEKELLRNMSDEDFAKTVTKPSGQTVAYVDGPSIPQMTYNTEHGRIIHSDATPMTSEEYAKIFNDNVSRLNEIIAKNNKSGVRYEVDQLFPNGQLRFKTPEQTLRVPNTNRNAFKIEDVSNQFGEPTYSVAYPDPQDPEAFTYDFFKTKEEAQTFTDKLNANQPEFVDVKINAGTSQWDTPINAGRWEGEVEDIANKDYFKSIPGLNMSVTSNTVFADRVARPGTGTYKSLNEFLKELNLGRVKPGFNSQTKYSFSAWDKAAKKGEAVGYYADPSLFYGVFKKRGGDINAPYSDFQKYVMKEMGGMLYANKDAGLPHKQSMQKYLTAENNLVDFMKRIKVVGGPVPFDEYYRENIINPRNKS